MSGGSQSRSLYSESKIFIMKKYTKHFVLIGIGALVLGAGTGYLIKSSMNDTQSKAEEITPASVEE